MNRREWLKRAGAAIAAVSLFGGVAKALTRRVLPRGRRSIDVTWIDDHGRLVHVHFPNAVMRTIEDGEDWVIKFE